MVGRVEHHNNISDCAKIHFSKAPDLNFKWINFENRFIKTVNLQDRNDTETKKHIKL